MLKNFSPESLGINGRQSELIELALTYGFVSMDVDMYEIMRRSRRTTTEDATKFLRAAMGEGLGRMEQIGCFSLEIDLDADDETFTSQVGALHPLADLAAEFNATRAYIKLPATTDRLPYHEFFEIQRDRLNQVGETLASKGIRLGVSFDGTTDLPDAKQFEFVRNVEGLIAIVKAVGSENVGYVIDTYDWALGKGGMDQLAEIPGDAVVAVRLGSLADDADAASASRSDCVLPIKEGALDHVAIVKHLIAAGYEGPIAPSASSSRYKGQTRENTVKEAQEAIDAICSDAGIEVRPLPMDVIEDIPVEPTPMV